MSLHFSTAVEPSGAGEGFSSKMLLRLVFGACSMEKNTCQECRIKMMIHNCLPLARQPVMARKSATAMRCSMLAAACAEDLDLLSFINPAQIPTHSLSHLSRDRVELASVI